tara:strand:+ start:614 stop:1537 length:924 start_codon:yes stop_codon:yes gene_type:complete
MKKLDTLVEDIYKKLDTLTEGKSLGVSEETADAFGEAMKNALLNWSGEHPQEQSTLRMSNIGKPSRQLWYDINSENKKHDFSAPVQIRFLYGHILEEVVLFLARLAGHEVTDEQKEVEVDGIKGHMDCKIDGEVIDIKTASGFAFKKFKEGTLASDDPFGYMAQIAGYEFAEGSNKGGFLTLNKENGELTLFRPEELDKPNVESRIKMLKQQMESDTPPERCYDPIPEGSSGNMKLPRPCVYCRHKFECHKDSNLGKGLRVFKYAKKYEYLTTVAKIPRVVEVTKNPILGTTSETKQSSSKLSMVAK